MGYGAAIAAGISAWVWGCAAPSLDEETIKTTFTAALQQMLDGQTGVDEVLDQAVRAELDTSALEAETE